MLALGKMGVGIALAAQAMLEENDILRGTKRQENSNYQIRDGAANLVIGPYEQFEHRLNRDVAYRVNGPDIGNSAWLSICLTNQASAFT
jgi:hypothetical protein